MKVKLRNIASYIIFLLAGILIFILIYRDQDVGRMKEMLKNDVDYRWLFVAVLLGLLSHISRSLRWNLLIESIGKKPHTANTFIAVMVLYLMNLVFPRMGEFARCGVIAKYEKLSFIKLVGTVIIERTTDIIMLTTITATAFLLQIDEMYSFFRNNPAIEARIVNILTSPYSISIAILFLTFILLVVFRLKNLPVFQKLRALANSFAEGLKSVNKLKKKGIFLLHSIFIWLMYFLMVFVSFRSFDFTSDLLPQAALTVFVLGSYGMLAPVQGGIGAWHFMTVNALALYGVAKSNSLVFAFLLHLSITLSFALIGVISVVLLPFVNRLIADSHEER